MNLTYHYRVKNAAKNILAVSGMILLQRKP
jgi:hypothetical protein